MRLLVIVIFHTLELVGETDAGSKTELQHQVMIEAVENHMPQVIIIDEIGTELEVLAKDDRRKRCSTCYDTWELFRKPNKNPSLADLIGGIQYVTLSDDEAKREEPKRVFLKEKLTLRLKS
jgi:stage III sporulation protein SpoIIIAA